MIELYLYDEFLILELLFHKITKILEINKFLIQMIKLFKLSLNLLKYKLFQINFQLRITLINVKFSFQF